MMRTSILAVAVILVAIIVIVGGVGIFGPSSAPSIGTLTSKAVTDTEGNPVLLQVTNTGAESLDTADLDVFVNEESASPAWFENKIEAGLEATAILGVPLSEGDNVSILYTPTGSVIHEYTVENISVPPPPPSGSENIQVSYPTSTSPVPPAPSTGPPPVVAIIGGTISGLENGDNVYITAGGVALWIPGGGNGPWFMTLPREGEYSIIARASGYECQPSSYTVQVSEGDNIASLDFEFSKI